MNTIICPQVDGQMDCQSRILDRYSGWRCRTDYHSTLAFQNEDDDEVYLRIMEQIEAAQAAEDEEEDEYEQKMMRTLTTS